MRSRKKAKKRTALPEEPEKSLPQKPESVRMGIVCLYGAAFISACFLILNGQVQWHEEKTEALTLVRIALLHMGFSAVQDAGLGFIISRCLPWSRWVLVACTGISLVFHAATFAQVAAVSPGFCISRLLVLFMEIGAVALCFGQASRGWFASLSK